MKTVLVNVPDMESEFFNQLVKKFGFASCIISKEDMEDIALAKWIDSAMQSEEVSEKSVMKTLKKNGVKV